MISLPVIPESKVVSDLFPEAVVIYGYTKGVGYERVSAENELEIGKGYWILLNEAKDYTLNGEPIESYTHMAYENGWAMIGACSSESKPLTDSCSIGVIYGYVQGVGYQRVIESENLIPGKGYWILFSDITDPCEVTVEPTG